MITLLIATRNEHKIGEIRSILGNGFECLSLREFPGAPEVVEDASTFAGNASKKAIELAKWLAKGNDVHRTPRVTLVLADDSGLEVDALNGKPGVQSARFAALDTGAAGNSSSAANNGKLLRLLDGVPSEKRSGRFRCALALAPVVQPGAKGASPVCDADEIELQTELFEGVCEGRLGFEPRGRGGFGYDPLFIPAGYDQTFAEMGDDLKNGLSHRAKALAKLRERIKRRG